MELHWLTGYPKDLIKDVKLIKKSGMACTNVVERPLIETATGKIAHICYEVIFKGSVFQYLKARTIMHHLHKD